MTAVQTDIEQAWQTLEALPLAGREIILARLANKKANEKTFSPPKTLLEDERFLISFEDYLALSDAEGEQLKLLAYDKYQHWIYDELARRRAKWMLICNGKIIEWSPTFDDYPSDEKMDEIGKRLGYAPFTFIANPVIEESYWTVIQTNDFYPSLTVTVGAANWSKDELMENGMTFNADFDTGSPDTLLDYTLVRTKNIIPNQRGIRTETGRHLGLPYACHVLPVQFAAVDETGIVTSKIMPAVCVRDWQRSTLCIINPVRKALLGRNLIYKMPLRVELDGGNRTTKILTASS